MKDTNYYKVYEVMDRLEEVRQDMKMCPGKISTYMNYSITYWSSMQKGGSRNLRLTTLHNLAQKLDISMEWLLYGINKGSYVPVNLDMYKIATEVYHKRRKCSEDDKVCVSVLSRIRKNPKLGVTLKMYYDIENRLGIRLLDMF